MPIKAYHGTSMYVRITLVDDPTIKADRDATSMCSD